MSLTPTFVLRPPTGDQPPSLSCLHFSQTRPVLYSGDADGYVAQWDLKTFRQLSRWRAHAVGVLEVAEMPGGLLTQGRDSFIRFFADGAIASEAPEPEWELPLRLAIGFCKFSTLMLLSEQALVAVPGAKGDEFVDVWCLGPGASEQKEHEDISAADQLIGKKTGTVMALSLFELAGADKIKLAVAYESGSVALFDLSPLSVPLAQREHILVWELQAHREAALSLSRPITTSKHTYIWSCGADHQLARFDVALSSGADTSGVMQRVETATAGKAQVAIRAAGKLMAVAGWDGIGRVYSPVSGKPLAILQYHRETLQAVAVGPVTLPVADDDEEDGKGTAYVAFGGGEGKISLWNVFAP